MNEGAVRATAKEENEESQSFSFARGYECI